MKRRIVFDTNVVLSALLFSAGRLSWLRGEWQSARTVPLVSQPTADELVRVLGYSKFRLSQVEREELLGDYLPYAEVVEIAGNLNLPRCRDEHDQMFLELATAGKAEALVTGDPHLIEMSGSLLFQVLTPAKLGTRLGRG